MAGYGQRKALVPVLKDFFSAMWRTGPQKAVERKTLLSGYFVAIAACLTP
jgi:hypothetical protein